MFLDFYTVKKGGYYTIQKGGLCYDESDVIRSLSDCEEALKEIGYSSLNKFWISSTIPIPAGCSLDVTHSNPFFSEKTSGLGKKRKDLTPVCIKTGTNVLDYLKGSNIPKRFSTPDSNII